MCIRDRSDVVLFVVCALRCQFGNDQKRKWFDSVHVSDDGISNCGGMDCQLYRLSGRKFDFVKERVFSLTKRASHSIILPTMMIRI